MCDKWGSEEIMARTWKRRNLSWVLNLGMFKQFTPRIHWIQCRRQHSTTLEKVECRKTRGCLNLYTQKHIVFHLGSGHSLATTSNQHVCVLSIFPGSRKMWPWAFFLGAHSEYQVFKGHVICTTLLGWKTLTLALSTNTVTTWANQPSQSILFCGCD